MTARPPPPYRPASPVPNRLRNRFRRPSTAILAAALVGLAACGGGAGADVGNFRPSGPWTTGRFSLSTSNGRPVLLSPDGRPFYAVSMVYAFDPEAGPYAGEKSFDDVRWDLEAMQAHGFNTANIYGERHLAEILSWCDAHGMAVYLRSSPTEGIKLSDERRDFPDFMDPAFREAVKRRFDPLLEIVKDHPSFMALDMDQRWLFLLDWSGARHGDVPMLGPAGIAGLPKWLEERHKNVAALNAAWGKAYASFGDVLRDPEIHRGGHIQPMGRKPWRLDLVEYANFTVDDFHRDLSAYLKGKVPGLLVTYTTEHPEVAPFPLTTAASGIDFISPVHYNKKEYYDRDPAALAKLIYETRFHFDMQGLPVYISETGWRTDPLDQWPPHTGYAFARQGDEPYLAGLYLRQVGLLHAMPWMIGWAHFKMYDKVPEGDFGYLRDDRREKPVSTAGRAVNPFLPVATSMPANRASLLYPRYGLAHDRAGFRQFTSLVQALEFDALAELSRLAEDALGRLPNAEAVARSAFATDGTARVAESWLPFRFAASPAEAEGTVLLAADPLELLSVADREALAARRTLTIARAGIFDERFRPTTPWFLEAVGLAAAVPAPRSVPVPLGGLVDHDGVGAGADLDGRGGAFAAGLLAAIRAYGGASFAPVEAEAGPDNVRCAGQVLPTDLPPGVSEIHVAAAVCGGDAAFPVRLAYEDGTEETVYMGTAAADWGRPEGRPNEIAAVDLRGRRRVAVHLSAPVHPLKRLKGIGLPDLPDAHVFAVTALLDPLGRDVPVSVEMDGRRLEGVAPWAVFLPADAVPADRVLGRFSDGRPAIVLSADGRRAAFLFDALTWAGSNRAVSRDVETLSRMLLRVLERLEASS